MPHVTEFEIEGLAGRSDAYAQKLDRYVNIFFGPNGSGKTTLLKILESAHSGNIDILRGIPFRRALVRIQSYAFDKTFTRTFDAVTGFSKQKAVGFSLGKDKPQWSTDPEMPQGTEFFFLSTYRSPGCTVRLEPGAKQVKFGPQLLPYLTIDSKRPSLLRLKNFGAITKVIFHNA